MADTKLIKLEVTYGETRYMVNLYGTRIGKIFSRVKFKGELIWVKLDAGTPIHDAVKKKALQMVAPLKEDRKKK